MVISDGETWAGEQHAAQALLEYRRRGLTSDAKLIVINMVANRTKLSDPQDPGSLDIVGFEASTPVLMAGFLGARQQPAEDAEVA